MFFWKNVFKADFQSLHQREVSERLQYYFENGRTKKEKSSVCHLKK